MTPWMRTLHKWVGLLLGIQFMLWMASGLMMSLLDPEQVQGSQYRIKPPASPAWPSEALALDTVLASQSGEILNASTGWLLDEPVYRLTQSDTSVMLGALDGKLRQVDARLAGQLARASYSGSAKALPARRLAWSLEARGHEAPLWRVDFQDAEQTSVYVSEANGAILAHRNATWRWFDLFWMLHIMDYGARSDINNTLLVTCALAGLWLALTGAWLLVAGLRLSDLVPARWRGSAVLELSFEDGSAQRIEAQKGQTLFDALARNGLQLPSNCGGGQSCGLCHVRLREPVPPADSAERALLSPEQIACGVRLACNVRIAGPLHVMLGDAAAGAGMDAVVTRVRALTAFLREITIRPQQQLAGPWRAGAYLQLHIPAYAHAAGQLHIPEAHRADWQGLALPAQLNCAAPLRRAYSLALPTEQADGQLTLLVRMMAGQRPHPPGQGSSYVYSLREGDAVRFSGPFGQFALAPGAREKVFIGGGAGMAPLRAMICTQLAAGATETIHFWYGARSLREAPYLDEMDQLAARHANLRWQLVLSEQAGAGAGPQALHGLVHAAVEQGLLKDHPDLDACDFYLCGPPGMLAATRAMLHALGVCETRIAFDDFKI